MKHGISVVIPLHNSEAFMDRSIGSVLAQLTPGDEILLVENGSSDGTLEKAQAYSQQHPAIRTLHLEGSGVSAARNAGIEAARDEWITFLDADDALQPGALDLLRAYRGEADLMIGGYRREMLEAQAPLQAVPIDKELLVGGCLRYAKYQRKLLRYGIDKVSIWTCWGKFYRRTLLERHCVRFPVGVALSEDTAFCYQCYAMAERPEVLHNTVYYYYVNVNPTSVTQSYHPNLHENHMRLLDAFWRYDVTEYPPHPRDAAAFAVARVIEIAQSLCDPRCEYTLHQKKEILRTVWEDPRVQTAVRESPRLYLKIGKRNSINYFRAARLLKKKKYLSLLTMKFI